MKRFSLVLCSIIALILILPAAHATISNSKEMNYVGTSAVVGDINVTVDIRPNTLSYQSKGEYVTCYITPPEDYTVHDIDVSSIFLETLQANLEHVGIIDRDCDGVYELMVKFERPAVLDMVVGSSSYVELSVSGSFVDGMTFFGSDTVHVACINPGRTLLDPIVVPDDGDALDLSVTYQFQGEKPKHYAVIVGISDYKAISDLQFCDEDANDWYSYLAELGYDEITVLGDDTNFYLKFDGLASEYNAKKALFEMISQAGPRDTIAFISSGHGSGDSRGASLLCMWDITVGENGEDGYFWDYELAALLELSIADQVFIFLDHCFAGGFGEELMSMSNSKNVYFASTCDIMGMGWDAAEYNNGLWTYFFLEYTLIDAFDSDPRTAMETAFDYAAYAYPYPRGAHHPQEFDGDPDKPFLLW